MAEHGTVEYATAAGNDYPTHERSYERFVQFTAVGILYVVTILLGLTVGGVLGHWFLAFVIFIVGLRALLPDLRLYRRFVLKQRSGGANACSRSA
jgi:hypothetical protein